jgi:hypothetical protein
MHDHQVVMEKTTMMKGKGKEMEKRWFLIIVVFGIRY